MALVALIAASEALDDGTMLRALAAGAETLFIVVGAVPPELLQALDRVRRRGSRVQVVRDAADLQTSLQPTDRLLLVADGLIAPPGQYKALAVAAAPSILVTADTPLTHALERVDAAHRWGGLALVPAASVAELAALPGEWDIVLTLLRFAIQANAARLECEPALFGQGEISIVSNSATASQMEQVGIERVEYGGMGLGRSLFSMPLVRLLGPPLVRAPHLIAALPWITGAAWLAAAVATGLGRELAAALAGVSGCIGLSALRFLAAFRLENVRLERLRGLFRGISVILLAGIGWVPAMLAVSGARPPLVPMALGLSLAAIILLARRLYAELGAQRAWHWLLPDADQAWLVLAVAAAAGLSPAAIALLPLAGLAQLLLWLRLAPRRSNRV